MAVEEAQADEGQQKSEESIGCRALFICKTVLENK